MIKIHFSCLFLFKIERRNQKTSADGGLIEHREEELLEIYEEDFSLEEYSFDQSIFKQYRTWFNYIYLLG